MVEDKSTLIPFLNKLALFRSMTPAQVAEVVDNLESVNLEGEQRLFTQGEEGDSLYIVLSGKILIRSGPEGEEKTLATFSRGDIFGEESLIYSQPRSASAMAAGPTQLLRLDKDRLENLLREFPYLKTYLQTLSRSRREARRHTYPWLAPGETIHLMARRHVAVLMITLIQPVLVAWVGLIFLYLGAWLANGGPFSTLLLLLGAGVLLFCALWAIWLWIDWGNDYYIVTDQRVVWIEKIILLYDSRNEAPLSTVLSVVTQSDQLGRWFAYGDVIVKTYTGSIVMQRVANPTHLAAIISELQERALSQVKEAQTALLEQEIRKRLGLPEPESPRQGQPAQPSQPPPPARVKRLNPFSAWLHNLFMVRFEEKGVITYRKHPILLLAAIWKPTIAILLVLAVIGLSAMGRIPLVPPPLVISLGVVALLALVVWWIYEYIDWRNDLYQVTADQIIDVYKKPLGREEKKVANLENILSLQHQRKGIIGLLLNYGDVIAMVGGTPFTFDGVLNPAAVEQDIFERIRIRNQAQKNAEDARERERVADWMAAYHRQMEALRRGKTGLK